MAKYKVEYEVSEEPKGLPAGATITKIPSLPATIGSTYGKLHVRREFGGDKLRFEVVDWPNEAFLTDSELRELIEAIQEHLTREV